MGIYVIVRPWPKFCECELLIWYTDLGFGYTTEYVYIYRVCVPTVFDRRRAPSEPQRVDHMVCEAGQSGHEF